MIFYDKSTLRSHHTATQQSTDHTLMHRFKIMVDNIWNNVYTQSVNFVVCASVGELKWRCCWCGRFWYRIQIGGAFSGCAAFRASNENSKDDVWRIEWYNSSARVYVSFVLRTEPCHDNNNNICLYFIPPLSVYGWRYTSTVDLVLILSLAA